jgi:hypothetical protein
MSGQDAQKLVVALCRRAAIIVAGAVVFAALVFGASADSHSQAPSAVPFASAGVDDSHAPAYDVTDVSAYDRPSLMASCLAMIFGAVIGVLLRRRVPCASEAVHPSLSVAPTSFAWASGARSRSTPSITALSISRT